MTLQELKQQANGAYDAWPDEILRSKFNAKYPGVLTDGPKDITTQRQELGLQSDQLSIQQQQLALAKAQKDAEASNKTLNLDKYKVNTTQPTTTPKTQATTSTQAAKNQPAKPSPYVQSNFQSVQPKTNTQTKTTQPQKSLLQKVGEGAYKVANFLAPQTTKAYTAVAENFNPKTSPEKKIQNVKDVQGSTGKRLLEGASFLTPVGRGLSGLIKGGAVAGGLYAASKDKANPINVIEGVAGGAVGGMAIRGAEKVLGGIFKGVPERIMNSLLNEPLKNAKSGVRTGTSLGKEAVEKGEVGTMQGIYKKAISKIEELENSLQTKLIGSTKTVKTSDVRKELQPLIDKLEEAGDTTQSQAILKRLSNIEEKAGSNIPIARANEIKRTIYKEIKDSYGKEGTAPKEFLKAVARSFKEQIGRESGVGQINKDLSYYGRVRDALEKKLAQSQGLKPTGLETLGGAIGFGTGQFLPTMAAIGVKKAVTSTPFASGTAQVLNKLGKAGELPAMDVTKKLAQIGLSRVPDIERSAILKQQSSPTVPFVAPQPLGNNQANGEQNNISHSTNYTLPDQESQTTPTYITGSSPEEWDQSSQAAMMDNNPDAAAYFDKQYAKEVAYQKTAGGKKSYTGGQLKEISDIETSLALMERVDKVIDESKDLLGPIQGLKALNPYATESKALEAQMRSAAQLVGKAMEGGVLRKEDEEKYRRMLPQVTDTYEVAKRKVANVRDMVQLQLETKQDMYSKHDVLPDTAPTGVLPDIPQ